VLRSKAIGRHEVLLTLGKNEAYISSGLDNPVGGIDTGGGLVIPVVEGGEVAEVALHVGKADGVGDRLNLSLVGWTWVCHQLKRKYTCI
jgi:hypothetical protein